MSSMTWADDRPSMASAAPRRSVRSSGDAESFGLGRTVRDSTVQPSARTVDLLHGSFLARSAIDRYLRRHPVGSMRGSADRRSARQRFHGWNIFSLAA